MSGARKGCTNRMKVTILCTVLLSIALASLTVFYLLSGRQSDPCPADWNRRGRRCFKFTEPLIYDEGVDRCGELGAHPASVRSAAEDTWIFEQSGKDIAQHSTYYIGLKFSFGNGSFYWLDGTADTYRNWKSYAPLVSYGLCIEVERENGGRWDTAKCHKEQPFLCSMPVTKP